MHVVGEGGDTVTEDGMDRACSMLGVLTYVYRILVTDMKETT